jgi:hypothetical protein
MIPLHLHAGIRVTILIASAILFGATATVCTGFLLTQRTLRSLMVVATSDFELTDSAPGVRAMATARALGDELRRVPVDFGIEVSAGPVFAGNIGAENRCEYTLVGDAVNDAARLADRAKEVDGRVLCSGAALARAVRLSYGAGLRAVRSYYAAARRRRSFLVRSPTPRGVGLCPPAPPSARRPPTPRRSPDRYRMPRLSQSHRSHAPHLSSRVTYLAQWGIRVYDFAHCCCAGAHSHW